PHVAKVVEAGRVESVEREAAEDALLFALRPVQTDVKTLGCGRVGSGSEVVVDLPALRIARVGIRHIAFGEVGKKRQSRGVGIRDLIAREWSPGAVSLIGLRGIVDGEGVG